MPIEFVELLSVYYLPFASKIAIHNPPYFSTVEIPKISIS